MGKTPTLRDLSSLGFIMVSGNQTSWTLEAPSGELNSVFPQVISTKATMSDVRAAQQNANNAATGEDQPLIIAPSSTQQVESLALAGKISLFTAQPLRFIHQGKLWGNSQVQTALQQKKPSWVQCAILRLAVLARKNLKQTELAEILSISQPAVAKALKVLEERYLLNLSSKVDADTSSCLRVLEELYPQNYSLQSFWSGKGPIADQTQRAMTVLTQLGYHPLVSGDLAADHYAPWKLPRQVEIYVDGPLDMEEHGFLETEETASTLALRFLKDSTVHRTASWWEQKTNQQNQKLADPVIVYLDMLKQTDTASGESAHKLKEILLRKED